MRWGNQRVMSLKKIVATSFVMIIVSLLIDFGMQKVAERDEGYTRSNLWAYYLYTDSEIRGAPRISEPYHFTFIAQDGSQPQESSIVYSTDAPLNEVRNYLMSLGYKAIKQDGLSERWEHKGYVTPYFSVSRDSESRALTLTKVDFR